MRRNSMVGAYYPDAKPNSATYDEYLCGIQRIHALEAAYGLAKTAAVEANARAAAAEARLAEVERTASELNTLLREARQGYEELQAEVAVLHRRLSDKTPTLQELYSDDEIAVIEAAMRLAAGE
jgi:uncharacterized coiled-coil protein SlyX